MTGLLLRPAAGADAATYVVAYDIRDARRLAKVHKRTIAVGLRLNYSVYAADLDGRAKAALVADLSRLIDPAVDDVRLYRVPRPPRGAWFGPLPMADDLLLFGSPAAGLAARLARQSI